MTTDHPSFEPSAAIPRAVHAADPFALGFERSPVGVAIGRPGGEIVYVNEMMCNLLGKKREGITVGSFIDAAHPEHKPGVKRRLRSLENGECQTFVRDTRDRGRARPDPASRMCRRDRELSRAGRDHYGVAAPPSGRRARVRARARSSSFRSWRGSITSS